MTVYIKREDAIDTVLDVYYNTPDIDLSGERLEAAILNIPAADVVGVRHGQKLRPRRRSSKCCCDDSTCNGGVIRNTNQRYPNGLYPICPHCGAKLDIKRCLRGNSDDANIRRYY